MNVYDIAIIPGDGVGNEISDEAVKILDAVAEKYGFHIKTETFGWGCDYYLKHGQMMPDDMLATLKDFDALLLKPIFKFLCLFSCRFVAVFINNPY